MDIFKIYLELGFDHILDLAAYDHILFVMTLCVIYAASQWKEILILVTAFTIGHSLTLALSTLGVVKIPGQIIEYLIPITIIITGLYNIYKVKADNHKIVLHYLLASFFGLIHGLGFSNYLKALLSAEDDMIVPLLAFNVGVECGQIIIVGITILLSMLLVRFFRLKQKYWVWAVSSVAILVSIKLLIDL
jgi:hypothetical protein